MPRPHITARLSDLRKMFGWLKPVGWKAGEPAWDNPGLLQPGLGRPGLKPPEIVNAARRLDKHYIPSRYPNGFASGAPVDYYVKDDAEGAIQDADKILRFCESLGTGTRES